ncbi:flagellar brake protein [Virgibacillus oceani]
MQPCYASDDSFTPFTTVTNDLSGGGMSIIMLNGTGLDHVESKKAVICMVLEMNNGDYHYCHIKAEFVHINEQRSGIQTASLKFTSITSNVQQQIIRYCYERQREARKKELHPL